MEKVMPTFEYEPLVLFLEPETSNEEEERGDTSGARPLGIKTLEEELGDFKGGKESLYKEATSKTYAS
jgi:hypothetical protein